MRRRRSLLVPAALVLLAALAGGVVVRLRGWLPWLQWSADHAGSVDGTVTMIEGL